MSSSGAPRKIEGMKFRKVWVIAIEVIKIIRARGEKNVRRNAEAEIKKTAMRFV